MLENVEILLNLQKSMDLEAHILGLIGSEELVPWGDTWNHLEAQLNSDGDEIHVFDKFADGESPIERYSLEINVRRIDSE